MIRRPLLVTFTLLGLAATPAAAYFLTVPTLARQMNSRLGLTQLDTGALVEYLDPALPEGALRFDGWFRADGPDKVRLDVRWPEGVRSQIRNKDRQMSMEGDATLEALDPRTDFPLEFWVFQAVSTSKGTTALERFLKSQGVSMDEVSLDRIGNQVCWHIGSEGPDAAGAWLDHDSFRPVQLRFSRALPNGPDRQWITLRFVEWIELGDGAAMPLLIEALRGERAGWRLRIVRDAPAGSWPSAGPGLYELPKPGASAAPRASGAGSWAIREGMPSDPLTTPSGSGQYAPPDGRPVGN